MDKVWGDSGGGGEREVARLLDQDEEYLSGASWSVGRLSLVNKAMLLFGF